MTITTEQLIRLRADTPACSNLIHFNNAGSSLMPTPVFDAMVEHLQLERELGGYEAATAAQAQLERFYSSFATLLRVQPEEMAFVENATRGWDMAFYALPLTSGDRIITHESEYASNYLAFLQLKKRRGVEIDLIPSDATGQIDVDAIAPLITPMTKVIAITHVPSQGGLVNPAVDVGRIAREHGLWYLLDACQSVGQIDVDISAIGCHLLAGTGRKFLRGPRGTGFMYASNDVLEYLDPPFIDLHSAEWTGKHSFEWAPGALRFENFESHVAGRVGLAAAVDYALKIGLKAIETRVGVLASQLREQLSNISGVEVRDQGINQCGIVTFTNNHESPAEMAARLRVQRINISVTPQTYAQLDLGARQLPAVARASLHYYNTEDEITRFCDVVSRR